MRFPAAALLALLLATSACGASSTPLAAPTAKPKAAVAKVPYVALGDSYTAAPGVAITDANTGCFRSDHNYPSLIATARPDLTLDDRSCSGATTANLSGLQRFGGTSAPPQFDALNDQTRVVSLGIGGNDGGLFRHLVGASTTRTALRQITLGTRARLNVALRQIHLHAPQAKVFVVGYPDIVPSGATCRDLPVPADTITLARTATTWLNGALRSAATASDATYVDVAAASRGHELCSRSPWINGPRNLPGKAFAFHPFEAEQQAVAKLVLAQLPAASEG